MESFNNWNCPFAGTLNGSISLHDETLRDGLQSPSIIDPPFREKVRILHGLDGLGVQSVNVGLPAAGPRAFADSLRLCREISDEGLGVRACIAARTKLEDIVPAVEITQKTGESVRVMAFVGCSPIRLYAEGWTLDHVVKLSARAVAFAVKEGLKVTCVLEDAARAHPRLLSAVFRAAIEHGADRLCLCDTTGHATPDGTRNLLRFTRRVIAETNADIGIDWHGHDDRGLALINTLTAASEGADRLHGCVLGIGERVGNTAIEMLMLNLAMEQGRIPEFERINELCAIVSKATGRDIPQDHPSFLLAAG